MRCVVLAASLSIAIAACADAPTLAVDTNNLCAARQGITAEQEAGARMADKTIALTFDDGPAESTSELSTYLKGEGVKATFFINGVHVEGREEIVRQQIADGHLVGNHTHTHPFLTKLTATEIVEEVASTDRLLVDLAPTTPLYFRAPFGDWDANVQTTLSKSPMSKYKGPVGWDVGDQLTATTAADWACWQNGKAIEACGDLYLAEIRAKKKGIVLLHDGPPGAPGDKTLAMVKYVLGVLKADGYRFVRVDDVALASLEAPIGNSGKPGSKGPARDPCR
jgi:peptidoglycan-N-acetylglucosamine deacetylase